MYPKLSFFMKKSGLILRDMKEKKEELLVCVAEKDDLNEIVAITEAQYRKLYGKEFLPSEIESICLELKERYARTLSSDRHYMLVAKQQDQVIGYARLDIEEGSSHLSKLYLKPGREGNGVGSLLLYYSMDYVIKLNKTSMYLEVFRGNSGAIKFYLRNGFVKTGEHEKPTASGVSYGDSMTCSDLNAANRALQDHISQINHVYLSPLAERTERGEMASHSL